MPNNPIISPFSGLKSISYSLFLNGVPTEMVSFSVFIIGAKYSISFPGDAHRAIPFSDSIV